MRRPLASLGWLTLCALVAGPASSWIGDGPIDSHVGRQVLEPLRPLQSSECSERQGPFATQDSAWANVRQAESQGLGVSGVFPCYDGAGYRGYCFNVFFAC